jgi:hypothetical protein
MKSGNSLGFFLVAMAWFAPLGCQSGAKPSNKATGPEEGTQAATKVTTPSDSSFQLEEAVLSQVKVEELQEQPISMLLTTTGKVQFN